MNKSVAVMKRGCFVIGLLGLGMELWAQSISLEEYRVQVLNYNQEIQKSQKAVEGAYYTFKQIRTGFFPALDASGNFSYQPERVEFFPGTDLKRDNYGVEVGVVQNVYAGSQLRNQYRMAGLQQQIAQLLSVHTENNVRCVADMTYWTAVAHRELWSVSEEYLRLIQELYFLIQKRFENGAIAQTDLLMVENRLKEAEIQQSTAWLNYKTAVQALNILRGSAPETEVVLRDSIRHPLSLPRRKELGEVLKRRSDYQVAVQNIKLAELQQGLSRAAYLPRIVVGVRERFGTTPINLDGEAKWTTTFYTQLNIPLFHWGALRQTNRKSRTENRTRELERSQLQDQVQEELTRTWTQMTELLRRLDIVYSSLEIARNNLELNTFSYNEGRIPLLDVLSAQVSWLQAYTQAITVNYQYRTTWAEYTKICGGE